MAVKGNVDPVLACTVRILNSLCNSQAHEELSRGSLYCNVILLIIFLKQSFVLCTGCPDKIFLKE